MLLVLLLLLFAPPLERIGDAQWATWHPAALELGRAGAVDEVVAGVAGGRISPLRAGVVFAHLPERRALVALVDHPNPEVRAAAIGALVEAPTPDAAPALRAALGAAKSGEARWAAARALWACGRDAAAIVAAARAHPKERGELFDLVDRSALDELLTEDERLEHLLTHRLAAFEQGPEVLNAQLPPRAEDDLYWTAADRTLLRARGDEVRGRMRRVLAENGSPRAALVLGWLRDRGALPELRRQALSVKEFYGWETSLPDIVSAAQFPRLHAYVEAIEHISGRPLEESVRLTEAEVKTLRERAVTEAVALHLLLRLQPAQGRATVLRGFRDRPPRGHTRFELALLLAAEEWVKKGSRAAAVQAALGPPDVRRDGEWRWRVGGLAEEYDLVGRFADGRLTELELFPVRSP